MINTNLSITTTQLNRINFLVNELVRVNPQALEKNLTKLSLLEKAKKINLSIDKNAGKMTMSEITKEVRAYRNEKKNGI